jgi:hypothetical protein
MNVALVQPSTQAIMDHVIYKDGKAFLIVNATRSHAQSVLASLQKQSDARFTISPL